MERVFILDPTQLREEIKASHLRSRRYRIDPENRVPNQVRLLPAALKKRLSEESDFLAVAHEHLSEFHVFLSPNDFPMMVVDRDGYILLFLGSDEIKEEFAQGNCAVGFRFTERDVGTTAISLCLEKQIPVQLCAKDHYCKQAHGSTSSAAPIFDQSGRLLGVVAISGKSEFVHPHTLVMMTSAANAIERQLEILRRNKTMYLNICLLDSVIEAAGTALLTIDRDLNIIKANRKAKQILDREDLDGKPITVLGDIHLDFEDIHRNPGEWTARECHIRKGGQEIHLVFSAQPVLSQQRELMGVVLAFEEYSNIRKLADDIAGAKAYFTFGNLIGSSPRFLEAVELAKRASNSDSTILLQGETGTGKEMFAQAIHNASLRRKQPFVPINCGAIPGELLESELFGYADGAFTGALRGGRPGKFELASGGTILLDEIGDMPPDMQVKLLRVLQTGEVQRIGGRKAFQTNPKVIACTHVNLAHAVSRNLFRRDLFYRLNVISIRIPSLRERGTEDILTLVKFFLSRNRNTHIELTPKAKKVLLEHDWPGNVRELENTILRALHVCEGNVLDAQHISLESTWVKQTSPQTGSLQEMERKMISATLAQTGFNMAATAKKLGISRATLYRKTKMYSL